MEIIFVLVPLSLLIGLCGLAAYGWALRRGQFDDLDSPPLRLLCDEEPVREKGETRIVEP